MGGWVSLRPEWVIDQKQPSRNVKHARLPDLAWVHWTRNPPKIPSPVPGQGRVDILDLWPNPSPHQTSDGQIQKFFCRAVVNTADQAMGRMKSLMPTSRRTQG